MGSQSANQQIRKKIESNTNVEYDKNGQNSIFNNNMMGSPDKEGKLFSQSVLYIFSIEY